MYPENNTKYKIAIERMISANENNVKEIKNSYVRNDVAIFLSNVQERIEDGILILNLNAEMPLCRIVLKVSKGDTVKMRLDCKFVEDDGSIEEYSLYTHSAKNEEKENGNESRY